MIEAYEIRMRTKSVGLLVGLASIFLIAKSHLSERQEVGVLRWFGLAVDWQTIRQTFWVIVLNSILFAGEIW